MCLSELFYSPITDFSFHFPQEIAYSVVRLKMQRSILSAIARAPLVEQRHYIKKNQIKVNFNLAQGVPFYEPPPEALTAICQKLSLSELQRYSPDEGRNDLRSLFLKDYLSQFASHLNRYDVLVTPGSNQAALIALATIARRGDEIILISPYYFNHRMALEFLGIRAKIVPADNNFQPDPDLIKLRISPRTRAVIIVSPNNPAGTVTHPEIITAIYKICENRGIYLIADEAYAEFCWQQEHFSPLKFNTPYVISLHSFSKCFAVSGWRIGFLVIDRKLTSLALKAADLAHISANHPAQILAIELIKNHRGYAQGFHQALLNNLQILRSALNDLKDFTSYPECNGAFYLFLTFKNLKSGFSGRAIANWLLQSGIRTLPGEVFGYYRQPALRISYGNLEPQSFLPAAATLQKALQKFIKENKR